MWWMNTCSSIEPQCKSTWLIDGEMKGIMDNSINKEQLSCKYWTVQSSFGTQKMFEL